MVPPAQPFEFSLAPWPSSSFGAAGKLTCPDLTGSARRQICKSTMRLLRPWWTAVCKQSRACLRHQWVLVIREYMSACGSQRLQQKTALQFIRLAQSSPTIIEVVEVSPRMERSFRFFLLLRNHPHRVMCGKESANTTRITQGRDSDSSKTDAFERIISE